MTYEDEIWMDFDQEPSYWKVFYVGRDRLGTPVFGAYCFMCGCKTSEIHRTECPECGRTMTGVHI